MALVAVKGAILWPDEPCDPLGSPDYAASMTMTASTHKAAAIIQAPKTGTISKIAWRTGTVTTGATVDVRLETVTLSTGAPSGTLEDTNTNGSQVVADANDNVWFTTTLTAGASVTIGDILAVVIANAGSGNMIVAGFNDVARNVPYTMRFDGTTWTKFQGGPVIAFEYNDGSYPWIPGVHPASTLISTDIQNIALSKTEYGFKFKVPFPLKVIGAWIWSRVQSDANTLALYDSDGVTVFKDIPVDANLSGTTGGDIFMFTFDTEIQLLADTFYRLALRTTDTVNPASIYGLRVNAVAVMDAMPMGQDCHATHKTFGSSSWSETTTERPYMGLMISALGDGNG
jgi:hypothetical protein